MVEKKVTFFLAKPVLNHEKHSFSANSMESVSLKPLKLGSVEIGFFKQKTAYEIMSGDWSSDVCSSD
eukprot:COSAG02_NODE_47890_length_338_cov_0.569038_1_plen_66_part_01